MNPLDLPILMLVAFFRTVVAEPYTIPASSMAPTLEVGDYLMVSKFSYGYSNYSTPLAPLLPEFTFLKAPPKRGDIVIFALPSDPRTKYIKRVIGLPGDRLQLVEGIVRLNDVPLKREALPDYQADMDGPVVAKRYRESLPDGRSYDIIDMETASPGDDTAEFIVPPGHYFMLGDNRDNSNDSRFPQFGFVPEANVVAKAFLLVDKVQDFRLEPFR